VPPALGGHGGRKLWAGVGLLQVGSGSEEQEGDGPWEPEQKKWYLWKWVGGRFGGTCGGFSSGAVDRTCASYRQKWR